MKLNKTLSTITFAFLGLIVPTLGFGHGGERVETELETPAPLADAGSQEFKFILLDAKDEENEVAVGDQNLNVVHEKKIHMFVYDKSLSKLHHVHPEYVNDRWTVTERLPNNGDYFMWSQGELAVDGTEFSSKTTFTLRNGEPATSIPASLGNVRTASDGNSQVTMSNESLRAGRTAMPLLTFSRTDGTQPEITEYLGAKAHVIIVSLNGENLIHAHPMDHGTPNQLMLHAKFPDAGDYRVWVQFMDGGNLKTVPLSVNVLP